jgi:hypothetical protein
MAAIQVGSSRPYTALPRALVVMAFCIIGARAMRPGDAPESRRPARGPWRRRQALGQTQEHPGLSRGQPFSMGDTLSGAGRAARRTAGARGSGPPRSRPGTRGAGAVEDGPGGAVTCSEMGRLPTIGQGHVGKPAQSAADCDCQLIGLREVHQT